MPLVKENNLESSLFRFESCSCNCVIDIEHIMPGIEPMPKYKIQAIQDKRIVLAFAAQKGLVRIAPDGTICEPNILGTIIALPNKTQNEWISFFERNGYVFPVLPGQYEEIESGTLISIIERLRITVELMSAVSEINKDFLRILRLTLRLMFAPDIKIITNAMSDEYNTHHYSYVDLLTGACSSTSFDRQREAFLSEYYTVSDEIYGTYQFPVQEYNDICGGYSEKPGWNDSIFRGVAALYLNLDVSSINKTLTHFLFHFFHDVGMINISNGFEFYDKPDLGAFSDKLKAALLKIARFVIGEEINANLFGIHPVYDPSKMSPAWKVENLLCALYFSIFYLRPELELYRPCDNPNCGKYFLVKTTSTKTRYCSTECCNRVTQARYRKKCREKGNSK